MFAWARKQKKVAEKVSAVERIRVSYIADLLRDLGFPSEVADWWAEAVYLVVLGEVERMGRSGDPHVRRGEVASFVPRMILAAASLEGPSAPRVSSR